MPVDEDRSDPEAKWWWRLGHHGNIVRCVTYVMIGVAMLTGTGDEWWAWVVLGLWLLTGVCAARHDFQALCVRCLREVPDDGSAQAQAKDHHLVNAHRSDTLRGSALKLLVFVAGGLAFQFVNQALGNALYCVVFVWVGYDFYSASVHRPLKPWCKYCPRDDGGGPDGAPTPTPDPSIAKTA